MSVLQVVIPWQRRWELRPYYDGIEVCVQTAALPASLFSSILQAEGSTTHILHTDALASIPRSLTALIYQERSLPAAREFVHSYFLSRQINLRGLLKFYNPKKSLMEMVQKYGREPPKSRYVQCVLGFQSLGPDL